MARPNWEQLQKIREVLLAALPDRGVQRVEFVTAFIEPYDSWVWLGTSTDTERYELLDVPDLLGLVHDVMKPSGLELSLIAGNCPVSGNSGSGLRRRLVLRASVTDSDPYLAQIARYVARTLTSNGDRDRHA